MLCNSRLIRNLEIQGGETARYVPLYASNSPINAIKVTNMQFRFRLRVSQCDGAAAKICCGPHRAKVGVKWSEGLKYY